MDPELKAALEQLRQDSAHLGEIRQQLVNFPTRSELKESEDRVVAQVVADLTAKQEAEFKALKETEIAALWAKQEEADERIQRAMGVDKTNIVKLSERQIKQKSAFRGFLHNNLDINTPAVREFLAGEIASYRALSYEEYEALAPAERHAYAQRTLTISAAADGGFLVPPGIYLEMQKLFTRIDPVGELARKIQLMPGTDSFYVPQRTTNVETQGAAALTSETGIPTAAQPNFGLVQRFLHPLEVLSPNISYDWLRKVMNGESILAEWAGESLAYKRNYDYLQGNSAQKPQGLMTATSGTFITADSDALDTSGHEISAEDYITLQMAVKAPYRSNGVYMINTVTLGKTMKLRTNVGGPNTGEFLLPISARDGFPDRIFNRPFYTAEGIADTGTDNNLAALFGDFSKYGVAEDEGIVIFRDTMSQMPNTRILWRLKHDGCILNFEAFNRLKM